MWQSAERGLTRSDLSRLFIALEFVGIASHRPLIDFILLRGKKIHR